MQKPASVTMRELRLLYPGKSEAWYRGWRLADMDIRQQAEEKRLAQEEAGT